MRNKRASRVEVSKTVEVDLTFSADVDPGYPPPPYRDHDDPAFADPGGGPEVDDVRLVLSPKQVTEIRRAGYRFPHSDGAGVRMYDATPPCAGMSAIQVAEFALGVLSALGVQPPDDDEFQEALGDDEPSEDDLRDAREDR